MYLIWTDASCQPFHPQGVLTWAFLVKRPGKGIIHQDTAIIGWGKKHHTNNLGEMTAVMAAVHWLSKLPKEDHHPVILHSDSELIVNQCSGTYNCHDPRLRAILDLIEKAREKYTRGIIYKWIPRERNIEADALSRSLYTEEMLAIMRANRTNIIQNWDNILW